MGWTEVRGRTRKMRGQAEHRPERGLKSYKRIVKGFETKNGLEIKKSKRYLARRAALGIMRAAS